MKNGLKGITDATVFCKSMQKGGPKPMIRDMKSYELGGVTGTVGLQTENTESSDKPRLPRVIRDAITDVKRGFRKMKNNMQINNYQNSKSKNNSPKKSPGYNKLREQQKSQNHKCTGAKGCI